MPELKINAGFQIKTGWKSTLLLRLKQAQQDYCGFGCSVVVVVVVELVAGAAAASPAGAAAGAVVVVVEEVVVVASSFLPQAVKTKAAIKVARITR